MPSIISLSKLWWHFFFFLLLLDLCFEESSLSWRVSVFCVFYHNTQHRFLFYYRLLCLPLQLTNDLLLLQPFPTFPTKWQNTHHLRRRGPSERVWEHPPQWVAQKKKRGDGSKNGGETGSQRLQWQGELALWYVGYRVTAGQRVKRWSSPPADSSDTPLLSSSALVCLPPSASLIPQPPPSLCLFSWLDVFTSEKKWRTKKKRCCVLILNVFLFLFWVSFLQRIFASERYDPNSVPPLDPYRDETFIFLSA